MCDLAETYHIFNYRALPLSQVAALVFGLPHNSRTMMAVSGQKVCISDMLLMSITDRLSMLIWMLSEDGRKGKNKPKMLLDALREEKPKEIKTFASGEDFEKARQNLMKGG